MTVDQLLSSISSEELTEWMAYFSIEPFGPEIRDAQFAQIAAVMANLFRDKKKKPLGIDRFMVTHLAQRGRFRRQKSPEEQVRLVEIMNAAMGGRDLRKR